MANPSQLVPVIAALLLTCGCDSASRSDTPAPPALPSGPVSTAGSQPGPVMPTHPPAKAQPAVATPRVDTAPAAPVAGHLPLARILTIVKADTPGEVIDVDYDEDDHKYEITVLTPAGRSIELEIDARTGTILDREED